MARESEHYQTTGQNSSKGLEEADRRTNCRYSSRSGAETSCQRSIFPPDMSPVGHFSDGKNVLDKSLKLQIELSRNHVVVVAAVLLLSASALNIQVPTVP